MDKQKTLVLVGAHPDDETFGMGRTLAHYAAAGVKAYYICSTRGEAGSSSPELMAGYATLGDLRWAELKCAAQVLGLTDVFYLGYRDSGMPGWEDNKHPQALMMAPVEEVAGRIVAILRQLKPEVVVTSDPIGGYGHPDHIAAHNATVKAFHAAGDPRQYPEAGPSFQPQKLYFSVMPHRMMEIMVRLLSLFGRDPHHFGRNRDIDLASLAKTEFPIHAVLRLSRQDVETRNRAAMCHASQLGGGPRRGGILGLANRLSGPRDYFMRAYPPPSGRRRESDLFEGIG